MGEIVGTAAHRILLAAALPLPDIETHFGDRIEHRDEVTFDEATASLRGRQVRRLGAVPLAERPMKVEPNDDTARLLAEGVARIGIGKLPWTKSLLQWRDRVMFLRRAEGEAGPIRWPCRDVDWLALLRRQTALAAQRRGPAKRCAAHS